MSVQQVPVTARPLRGGWELDVDGHGITRVRTLDQVVPHVRAHLAALVDREFCDFGVELSAAVVARVTPAEGWWAVEVVDVRGAFSQAKTWDEVPFLAADAVSTLLDLPTDWVHVTVTRALTR